MKTMITPIWPANESTTVQVLCVLMVPSTKVCSNISHLNPQNSCAPVAQSIIIHSTTPLLHLRCTTTHIFLGSLGLLGSFRRGGRFGSTSRLPGSARRTSERPLTPLQKIMPEDQNRASYKNRRISTNDDA